MDCIIVDEDKVAREAIKKLVSQVDFLKLKGDFDDPFSAVDYIHQEPVDLIFLDTDTAGKKFFDMIKDHEPHPIMIFVESKINFSLNTFEVGDHNLLLKPVTKDEFLPRVHKAKQLHDIKDEKAHHVVREFIFIRNKSVISKINIKDILYVQALGDYVTVFTVDGKHIAHITLSGIEKRLPAEKFCRIHRSHIVALQHIDNIEEGTVYIKHQPIPIGEQYRSNLLKMIDFI